MSEKGEEYLRVSYGGEVEEARAKLAETPHVCPVCKGRGTVSRDFYEFVTTRYPHSPVACRSCGGRGIVWRD